MNHRIYFNINIVEGVGEKVIEVERVQERYRQRQRETENWRQTDNTEAVKGQAQNSNLTWNNKTLSKES